MVHQKAYLYATLIYFELNIKCNIKYVKKKKNYSQNNLK